MQGLSGGLAGRDVRKLRGKPNEWRLRVGDWRIRFGLDARAQTVVILQVLPRGRAYRD
jgi:mRNA-degrading endonuclease RelE of RelBE toxin-antitoxin system